MNYRKLNKQCPNCSKQIDDRSTYCKSCSQKGKRSYNYRNGLGNNNRSLDKKCPDCGKEITDNATYCNSCARKGRRSTCYKHGLSKINVNPGRDSTVNYAEWMKDVFERDQFHCQHCNSNAKLRAHHIYSYAKYPELRLHIENGITFCEFHHKQLHQLFGNDVTSAQLKWFFANVK